MSSEEFEFEYDIDDNDIMNWRRETAGDEPRAARRQMLTPYRVYKVEIEREARYAEMAKRRVFRFFGNIDSVLKTKPNGDKFTELIVRRPHWRNVMTQGIGRGLAPLPSDVIIPSELRHVPVSGWGPLARAVRPSPKQKFMWHEGLGMGQDLYYWAAVLMTDDYTDNDGNSKTYEIPAILQLKRGQAVALARKVEEESEDDPDFLFPGTPWRIWQNEPKVTEVRLAKGKKRMEMAEIAPPDMTAQITAIVREVENILVRNNAPIKGFPFKDSHEDDGWHDDIPHADRIFKKVDEDKGDGLDEFRDTEPRGAKKGEVTKGQLALVEASVDEEEDSDESDDQFLDLTNQQLRAMADSLGAKTTSRTKREQLIAMIEELQP